MAAARSPARAYVRATHAPSLEYRDDRGSFRLAIWVDPSPEDLQLATQKKRVKPKKYMLRSDTSSDTSAPLVAAMARLSIPRYFDTEVEAKARLDDFRDAVETMNMNDQELAVWTDLRRTPVPMPTPMAARTQRAAAHGALTDQVLLCGVVYLFTHACMHATRYH